jgi:RNA polymerase sigma-70 factor (ECF subfamily)
VDPLTEVVREEWGRLVALLLAQFRRLDLVEDALGDAVEAAQRTWGRDGVPDNPTGWLLTTARRRLLDRLRTEEVARRTQPLLATEVQRRGEGVRTMADPGSLVEDDLLRLVLMCAHPALSPEAASALSLRLVLGVPTPDVARLFLVPEATMAARITRAKKRIVGAGIPFAVPDAGVLPERLDTVAHIAYLAFTAGYAPGTGPDLLRAETSGEAIRLVRVVLGVRPDEPVLVALLALMLLQHSRRDARVADGRLVLLPDQDRSRWHHDEIAEALDLLDHPALAGPLTAQAASYTLQARIAAEHALALRSEETRWEWVVQLYDTLLAVAPSPGARLARAVAVAESHGPAAGLAALDGVEMPASHRVAAVRAELLARDGDAVGARAAYDQAIAACRNDVELAHLRERRRSLDQR